jgi:hypothetical protein
MFNKTEFNMSKPTLVVADIYSLLTEKDAHTLWRERKATDMILSGSMLNEQGQRVYAFIMLTNTVPEEAAQKLINDTYTTIVVPQGYKHSLMAWIPMNNMREMVICDLDKDGDERVASLTEILLQSKAFEIMGENPQCLEECKVMFKEMV